MLFNYRYVTHPIETFQTWLDHLVKDVWCKAAGTFDLDLLHADLREVVLEIYNTEEAKPYGRTGDWLHGPIRDIFNLFIALSPQQRQQISDWYDNNNDIEALCANDPQKLPVTYAEIQAINPDLEKELKAFCQSLFTNVIHLKSVSSRTAEIDSHYDAFVAENDEGKCPYCGYGDIRSQDNSTRDAYDHFLPKGTYPFNSVNFKNLAPMCHQCNSSYKLQKDPVRHIDPLHNADAGTRRKAFFSYSAIASGIEIDLTLATSEIDKLRPPDITLTISAPGRDEEVEAWKDVFGIEERYKAKCCGKNEGMVWLSRVIEENENYGRTPREMLEAEIRAAENKPWHDSNFLKKPFLLACQKVIDALRE
jgi:hypothetical protein